MQQNTSDQAWQDFMQCCLKLNDLTQLTAFFEIFLTISEKEEIGNRFQIIRELITAKKTQREIARDLKVSIANVSRGSNALKTISYDVKKLLNI
jgi:TrpR family trp operon transcriptional repressor